MGNTWDPYQLWLLTWSEPQPQNRNIGKQCLWVLFVCFLCKHLVLWGGLSEPRGRLPCRTFSIKLQQPRSPSQAWRPFPLPLACASPHPLGYTTILICTLEFDILSQSQPSPEPFPGESCSTRTHFISTSQAPKNPFPRASPHFSGSCRNVAPSLWSTAWVTVAWVAEAQISIQGKCQDKCSFCFL